MTLNRMNISEPACSLLVITDAILNAHPDITLLVFAQVMHGVVEQRVHIVPLVLENDKLVAIIPV